MISGFFRVLPNGFISVADDYDNAPTWHNTKHTQHTHSSATERSVSLVKQVYEVMTDASPNSVNSTIPSTTDNSSSPVITEEIAPVGDLLDLTSPPPQPTSDAAAAASQAVVGDDASSSTAKTTTNFSQPIDDNEALPQHGQVDERNSTLTSPARDSTAGSGTSSNGTTTFATQTTTTMTADNNPTSTTTDSEPLPADHSIANESSSIIQEATQLSPSTEAVAAENHSPSSSNGVDMPTSSSSLEAQLAAAQAQLADQRAEHARRLEDDGALLLELQGKLQEHLGARAEAEDKARRTQAVLEDLQRQCATQKEELRHYQELKAKWDTQSTEQAEQENAVHEAHKLRDQLQEENKGLQIIIDDLRREVQGLQQDRDNQEEELKTIREQRDEQERREVALTNRLNAAKKKEADKANLAERFEDENKALRDELQESQKKVDDLSQAKILLEDELVEVKARSEARIRQAELALSDEKRLNEDRKLKMKAFIENKSEELRQSKADSESMQAELAQTSKSLMDLNNRWKQLHAQWVQSQTRNRELQRDLNRIKKDSENLHKVGDTLEMKLSRSATETEEHKNKRLAAKNELMTVLKTLEAEREVSARLRDAIKFTFTPKALSQQQLLRESIDELENELNRLSRRFGKPLPPLSNGLDASERSEFNDAVPPTSDDTASSENGKSSRMDIDIQRLISKLDSETQEVSQYIVALSGEIERLHMLIDASGSRNCYSALSEILLGGAQSNTTAGRRPTAEESAVPLRAIRSHQYGQIPSNPGS
jgi:hypothetical protein